MTTQTDNSTAKQSLLVISDDPALLEFVRYNLVPQGYHLITKRGNGTRLKEVLKALEPGLVIIDIMMPKMYGIEILLRVRQWSSAPTILLSSWRAGGNKVRSLDVHSANGLSDPFGIEELIKLIKSTKVMPSTSRHNVTPIPKPGYTPTVTPQLSQP